MRDARRPWKLAVIAKLLGKKVGLSFMRAKLVHLWQPTGHLEVIDLNHGYFVVRLSNSMDFQHVLDGGPWIIMGHYLVVQQWKPEFIPADDDLGKVAVWIRIPDFPVEYYGKTFLWRIGESLGRMVKIDVHSMRSDQEGGLLQGGTGRGSFARICVEVDLRKTLVAKFEFHDVTYKVEYEGLNQICFHCGRFGHRLEICPLVITPSGEGISQSAANPKETPVPEESQPFGDWMIAKWPTRRVQRPAAAKGGQFRYASKPNETSGSRFNALVNVEKNQEIIVADAIMGGERAHKDSEDLIVNGMLGDSGNNAQIEGVDKELLPQVMVSIDEGIIPHGNNVGNSFNELIIADAPLAGSTQAISTPGEVRQQNEGGLTNHKRSGPNTDGPQNVHNLKVMARDKAKNARGDGKSFTILKMGTATLAAVLEDPIFGGKVDVMTKLSVAGDTVSGKLGSVKAPGVSHDRGRPPDTPLRQSDGPSKEKQDEAEAPVCRERERSLSPGSSTRIV